MSARIQAGQLADYGVYACAWPPDLRDVGADGEALEGRAGLVYRRVPLPLVVVAGPVLGALFVVAFPLVVLAAVVVSGVRGFALRARAAAERHAWLTRTTWQPAAAYLHHQAGVLNDQDDELDSELQGLVDEVQARRALEPRMFPPHDPDRG